MKHISLALIVVSCVVGSIVADALELSVDTSRAWGTVAIIALLYAAFWFWVQED